MVRCPRAGTSDAVQGVTDGGNRDGGGYVLHAAVEGTVPGRDYGLVKEWPFGSLSNSLTRGPLTVTRQGRGFGHEEFAFSEGRLPC